MTSSAANDVPLAGAPPKAEAFFAALRGELEVRARMLLTSAPRHREGRLTPDDLVQECLGKLLASYDEASLRERPHNQLMALAYRTMRNIVIDEGRKKAALLADDPSPGKGGDDKQADARPDEQPSPEEALAQAGRTQAVRAALDALTPEERCFLTGVIETDSVPAAQKRCGWPDKSPYYVLKKLFERLRGVVGEWAP